MKILRLVAVLGVGATIFSGLANAEVQPRVSRDSGGEIHGLDERQPVILDTDIGDDIDDAFALGLALKSPEFKFLGITTAYGDTELRAKLVDRYLGANCEDLIPV